MFVRQPRIVLHNQNKGSEPVSDMTMAAASPNKGWPPDSIEVGASYSDKVRVSKCERLKRNVLEINLEYDSDTRPILEKEVIARMFSKIGIDIKSQVEGYQVNRSKIYVWCKDSCDLERFLERNAIKLQLESKLV